VDRAEVRLATSIIANFAETMNTNPISNQKRTALYHKERCVAQ
jgi:hypothetical protein